MPILTKAMREYVLNDKKVGYTRQTQSTYNRRIIEYAKRGLEDLTLLAEKLPEELQDGIFNEENLGPLLRKVFRLKIRTEMSEDDLEKRKRRILELSWDLLNTLGSRDNAYALAPRQMKTLTMAGLYEPLDFIVGIKAIILKAMG